MPVLRTFAPGDRVLLSAIDPSGAPSWWQVLSQITGSRWATVGGYDGSSLLVQVDADACPRRALLSDVVERRRGDTRIVFKEDYPCT